METEFCRGRVCSVPPLQNLKRKHQADTKKSNAQLSFSLAGCTMQGQSTLLIPGSGAAEQPKRVSRGDGQWTMCVASPVHLSQGRQLLSRLLRTGKCCNVKFSGASAQRVIAVDCQLLQIHSALLQLSPAQVLLNRG